MIKEFTVTESHFHVVIRFMHYSSRLSEFEEAFAVAKTDFPFITSHAVNVMHYGGVRYKGTWGIEFDVPRETTMPLSYTQIKELELTL